MLRSQSWRIWQRPGEVVFIPAGFDFALVLFYSCGTLISRFETGVLIKVSKTSYY